MTGNPGTNLESPTSDSPAKPLFSVSHGSPTAEELAAVTAVVLALQGGAQEEPRRHNPRHWARRSRLHLPPKPGAGAWRRSAK